MLNFVLKFNALSEGLPLGFMSMFLLCFVECWLSFRRIVFALLDKKLYHSLGCVAVNSYEPYSNHYTACAMLQ